MKRRLEREGVGSEGLLRFPDRPKRVAIRIRVSLRLPDRLKRLLRFPQRVARLNPSSDATPAPPPPPDAVARAEVLAGLRLWTRWIAVGLALAFVSGVGIAIYGPGGGADLVATRAELRALRQAVEDTRHRVVGLKREVRRLRTDPAAVERLAREDLGHTKPGEISFLLPHGPVSRGAEPEAAGSEGGPAGVARPEGEEPVPTDRGPS